MHPYLAYLINLMSFIDQMSNLISIHLRELKATTFLKAIIKLGSKRERQEGVSRGG